MHPVLHASPGALLLGGAASISPAKMHRHRYHGVLPPNSPLRGADTVYGRDAGDDPSSPAEVAAPPTARVPNARSPARYLWAMLLARLFESPAADLPELRGGHAHHRLRHRCRCRRADSQPTSVSRHASRQLRPPAPALRNPAPLGRQPASRRRRAPPGPGARPPSKASRTCR